MFIFRATNSQKAVNKYFHHDRFFSKKSHSTVGIAYYRSRWWWYDCWLLIQRDEKNDRRDRVFCCIYLSCLFIMANKYQAMQRKVFFLRVILPFPFAIQFFSIFQYGNKTAGVPVRVTFFEDVIVHYLHLPNPTVQWISFIFCMLIIIFCFPKESQ